MGILTNNATLQKYTTQIQSLMATTPTYYTSNSAYQLQIDTAIAAARSGHITDQNFYVYADQLKTTLASYDPNAAIGDILYGDASPTTGTTTGTSSTKTATTYSVLTPALDTSYFRYVTQSDDHQSPQAWTPQIQRTVDNSKIPWGVTSTSYSYSATDPNGSVTSTGDVVTVGSYIATQAIQHFVGPVASYPIVGGHTLEGTGITIGDPVPSVTTASDSATVQKKTIIENTYNSYSGMFFQDYLKLSEIDLKKAAASVDKDIGTILSDLSSLVTKFKSELITQLGTDLGQKAIDAFMYFLTDIRLVDDKTLTTTIQPGGGAVTGGPQKDVFMGTPFNDKITGGSGDDIVMGGDGTDTAVFSGSSSNYTVTFVNKTYVVTDKTGADGTDYVSTIERLQFSDKTIAIDCNGTGGQTYRMYQAAFDRKPDATGLGYWIKMMDNGLSLEGVAGGFTHSAEFQNLYGANATDATFVTKLYNNVLHRTPDQSGFSYWTGLLASDGINREQVLVNFSESTENQAQVIGVIQNGFEYAPYGS